MAMSQKDMQIILAEAFKSGRESYDKCIPTPMNVIDHESRKIYNIPDGVCGFAWVTVFYKGKGAQFINALKKVGLASNDINSWADWKKSCVGKGYQYWIAVGNQSMELKIAYAKGMVKALNENNIPCMYNSRLD